MTIDFMFGWADVAVALVFGAGVPGVIVLGYIFSGRNASTWIVAALTMDAAAMICAIIDVLVNHLRWVP